MLPLLFDRVKETTVTTGTGALALAGAVSGFQSFSRIGSGNPCYYAVVHRTSPEWEVGRGTFTGSALTRAEILDSSSAATVIDLSAGTKDVFVTAPAARLERAFDHPHPFFTRAW